MTSLIATLDRLIATPIEKRLRKAGYRPVWQRQPRLAAKVSLVVPCYNIGPYIDDFFASVFSQSTGLHNLEIIVVDDGSTDDTADRVKRWAARRPDIVRYHFQKNAGAAEARNSGLEHATGEWISFPDPDDFFHHHYLHHVNRLMKRGRAYNLSMISCNLLIFREKNRKTQNTHALKFRYTGETWLPIDGMKNFVQLSAAHAFYRRDLIVKSGLRFDGRIKPRFEDANFVNRYIARCSGHMAVFSKYPIYYYRKRADASSIMDNSHNRIEFYTNQLTHGWLGVLNDAAALNPIVPHAVQRAILYDTTGHLRIATERKHLLEILSDEQLRTFEQALYDTFKFIDSQVIGDFSLSTFHEDLRVGSLNLFKGTVPERTIVYVKEFDESHGMVKLTYLSESAILDLRVDIDGKPVAVNHHKVITTKLFANDFYHEHSLWFQLVGGRVSISRPEQPVIVRLLGKNSSTGFNVKELREAFTSPPNFRLPRKAKTNREYALAGPRRTKYAKAWLFMDRADKAGDNAEALYRYIVREKKPVNAFFILSKSSKDWQRLKKAGFRLIEFMSKEHIAALINSDFLLSSHGDRFIAKPLAEAEYGDLLKYRFIFLQHGVVVHDQSAWFNDIMPRILVTSSFSEHHSIVGPGSRYRLTERETKLTGLARHDDLLIEAQSSLKQFIFIMPTWREKLTIAVGETRSRRLLDGFDQSEYAQRWKEFLNSPRLKKMAEETGKTIVFCPHPNFGNDISRFSPPDWVTTVNALEASSLQPYFASTDVLITDYSSVAFDLAFLDRPVVYYQFDRDTFYKEHIYHSGYFDYHRDGFGPVAYNLDDALNGVLAAITGAEDTSFTTRRRGTFPHSDGKNCERIFNEIASI